jgi:hypothetical protein
MGKRGRAFIQASFDPAIQADPLARLLETPGPRAAGRACRSGGRAPVCTSRPGRVPPTLALNFLRHAGLGL